MKVMTSGGHICNFNIYASDAICHLRENYGLNFWVCRVLLCAREFPNKLRDKVIGVGAKESLVRMILDSVLNVFFYIFTRPIISPSQGTNSTSQNIVRLSVKNLLSQH